MHKNARFFLSLTFALLPLLSGAAEIPASEPMPLGEGDDRFFQEFMNMLTTLGLIVATIFVISWFLKRMVNTRIQQANTSSVIKILERRALSPKSALYLIEINSKQLLVGETPTGVATLLELPAEVHENEKSF